MQPKTIVIIAGTVLLVALVSLWFMFRSPIPPVNRAIFTSLGQVLAQETATAIHDRGQIVAVIADGYETSGTVLQPQWKAFTSELKKHSSISLAKPEIVPPGNHLPLGEILDRHTQAGAIVFYVDPPTSVDLDAVASRSALPKLIAIGNPDLPAKNYYGHYLNSGMLAALIIPRSIPSAAPAAEPKTPREWFDRYYQLYAPQNFDTLPE